MRHIKITIKKDFLKKIVDALTEKDKCPNCKNPTLKTITKKNYYFGKKSKPRITKQLICKTYGYTDLKIK